MKPQTQRTKQPKQHNQKACRAEKHFPNVFNFFLILSTRTCAYDCLNWAAFFLKQLFHVVSSTSFLAVSRDNALSGNPFLLVPGVAF